MREFAIIWLIALFAGLAGLIKLSGRSWKKSIVMTVAIAAAFIALSAANIWFNNSYPVTGGEDDPHCEGDDCGSRYPRYD